MYRQCLIASTLTLMYIAFSLVGVKSWALLLYGLVDEMVACCLLALRKQHEHLALKAATGWIQ